LLIFCFTKQLKISYHSGKVKANVRRPRRYGMICGRISSDVPGNYPPQINADAVLAFPKTILALVRTIRENPWLATAPEMDPSLVHQQSSCTES
jgi:hypothetical protein